MRKNFLKKAAVVALTTAMAFGMVPAMPATEAKAATDVVANASTWDAETLSETFTKDGFTFTAGSYEKSDKTTQVCNWVIENNGKGSEDGTLAFTKRIKSGGKSDKGFREIQFTTEDAADLVIYALASSESASRTVKLYSADDASTAIGSASIVGLAGARPDKGADDKYLITPQTIAIPAAGSYTLKIEGGGLNIYYLSVDYAEGGQEETKYTGLKQDENGKWMYYTNDEVDTSVTDLVWWANKWCYVKEGAYTKTPALVWHYGQWWYVNNGTIDKTYEGLVWQFGNWYYVKDGKYDSTKNGVITHNGKEYPVTNGKLY